MKLKCFGRILFSLRGFVPNKSSEQVCVYIYIYSFKNDGTLSLTNNYEWIMILTWEYGKILGVVEIAKKLKFLRFPTKYLLISQQPLIFPFVYQDIRNINDTLIMTT